MNSFLELRFYPDGDSGPVKDFLEALQLSRPEAYIRLRWDLKILGQEGARSSSITLRPLGEGLWELKRLFQGIQYRIFLCIGDGKAWLLHAIEKKSGKTPLADLRLARKRMRGLR